MGGWIGYGTPQGLEDWPAPTPTQDGVARRFVEAQAGRLRFCHDAGAWFVWSGAVWRRDRTGVVPHLIRLAARVTEGEDSAMAGGTRFIAGVERFARNDPALAVTSEVWDADPLLLGTPDGTVALDTGTRVPADPADGISRTTAIAPSEMADCLLWRRFLDETFGGDTEIIGFLQRFLGYALTGDTSEEAIVFGCGPGGTGKSVFLDVVLGVMGDYARTTSLATLTSVDSTRHGADLAALAGARLVAVAEGDGDILFAERRLKLMAGGDPIQPGGCKPTGKLIVMGTDLPGLRRGNEAMRRRIRIVPFHHRPARSDRGLAATLRAERPAILRWMIDGCLDWQAEGLGWPQAINEATEEYLDAQDPVGHFLAERCLLDDATRRVPAAALFAAWSDWADAAGEDAGSRRTFAQALSGRGFGRERSETIRFYRGIGLREPDA